MIHLHKVTGVVNFREIESTMVVASGEGKGEWGVSVWWVQSVKEDEEVLAIYGGMAAHSVDVLSERTVHLEVVKMVSMFYVM